ncbi:MAG: cupredoxin domain-containing protein [Actinobacteria bacterium]|nr:cupredoxin domain-containing protein [Actinomycetota bacterium]
MKPSIWLRVLCLLFTVAFIGCAQEPSVQDPAPQRPAIDGGSEIPADCSAVGADPFELEAEGFQFGTDCLRVAAGVAFRVELKNRDEEPHTFSIYGEGDEVIFSGQEVAPGTDFTYDVPALAGGTYKFQCDVHPEMSGQVFATS